MRYKLLLLATIMSGSVHASDWFGTKAELDVAYQKLDDKAGMCTSVTSRDLELPENDTWLNSLNKEQKVSVLAVLGEMAYERCWKTEAEHYSQVLIRYTAETGDRSHLDDWLKINQSSVSRDSKYELSGIDRQQVERLSQTEAFYFPFDFINAARKLKIIP
ncbi:hypothetical protein [Photobacterium sp. 1_MG-2023]|uniref:hypothetical protein n=1 Tax=Photobacterium sp. 1_MG-2023 TaxID=3062646 RepID=UPI0026E45275|nr:hypothetical protein [Photobacterium sp. 1_MG-2023]MDO6706769.1 hypothetical protein [Photobacterium sp. 1_MG-2023]